jgi:hypothetical protein
MAKTRLWNRHCDQPSNQAYQSGQVMNLGQQ